MEIPSIEAVLAGEPDAIAFAGAAVATLIAMIIAVSFLTKKKPVALNPTEFQAFKLIKKDVISHDTRKYTFALQTPTTVLGLPVGQHITLKFTDKEGKNVQRSYTPVTGNETIGTVAFVIKVYKANVHPKFPEGGKMSQHVDSLEIGDTLDMRGPKGHLEYMEKGKFTVKQMRKPLQTREAKHFGMIAGGTGITPMLQVVDAIFRDSKDSTTTASLLYANQSEDDILVREELESFAKAYPDRFTVNYTVDRPAEGWKGEVGHINKEMIEKHVLSTKADVASTQVFMCGPPPMLKFACLPNLKELGFGEDNYFSF